MNAGFPDKTVTRCHTDTPEAFFVAVIHCEIKAPVKIEAEIEAEIDANQLSKNKISNKFYLRKSIYDSA